MYELKDNERMTVKAGLESEWAESVGKNQDGYGHGVVEATVLVGAALDKGLSIKEAEDACYGLGITGFMAGCMAQWISYFHPRGDEFRRWWNTKYQVADEGDRANERNGVLNPAIFTIKA